MRDYNSNSGGRYHNSNNNYRHRRRYNNNNTGAASSRGQGAVRHEDVFGPYAESLLGNLLQVIKSDTRAESPYVRAYSRECSLFIAKCREKFAKSIRVRVSNNQYEKLPACSDEDWAHFAANVNQAINKSDLTLYRGSDETAIVTYIRGTMLYSPASLPYVPPVGDVAYANNIYILDTSFPNN